MSGIKRGKGGTAPPAPAKRPGRPTDERRIPYNISLRPSVVKTVEVIAQKERLSRSQAVERLICEALGARGKAT